MGVRAEVKAGMCCGGEGKGESITLETKTAECYKFNVRWG